MVEDGFELKLGATVIVISLKETPPVLNTLTKLNISVQSTKQGKNCWISGRQVKEINIAVFDCKSLLLAPELTCGLSVSVSMHFDKEKQRLAQSCRFITNVCYLWPKMGKKSQV